MKLKLFAIILNTFLFSWLICGCIKTPSPKESLTLQKKPGRDFVLLNLSDPQLTQDEWASDCPRLAILKKTISELVERVHPDLITVSGDISYAEHRPAYDHFADFMDSFGIWWAPVWGNHDNQGGPGAIREIAESYLLRPYCLFELGPEELGCGNYVIRIEEKGRPVTALFMMDTHDCEPCEAVHPERSFWSQLHQNQLDWYREQARALKQKGFRDSAMIMHIPFKAYQDAFKAAFNASIDPKTLSFEQTLDGTCWNDGYKDAYGCLHEGIGSHPLDNGALDLLAEEDFTKYVICGHDHINNFVIKFKGIWLVYSMKTGAGCYWEPALNGGTVLTIGRDGIKSLHHEFVDVGELAAQVK